MESHLKIIEELNNALSKTKEVSDKLPDQMEYAIGHCKIALDDMRKLVIKDGFADKESEIEFFKKLKPAVYSKLLYYREVFDLETKRQDKDKEGIRKYLQQKLDKIMECMIKNDTKVQYYHCNYSHLDEKYFLRDGAEIPLELRDNHHLLDEQFFTWHDHTFSMITCFPHSFSSKSHNLQVFSYLLIFFFFIGCPRAIFAPCLSEKRRIKAGLSASRLSTKVPDIIR